MAKLSPGMSVHLVGIGGSGLSAIARVLLAQGYRVSGSDRTLNALTDALAQDGARIHEGHAAAHIGDASALIISSAVPPDHVEVAAAKGRGIPVYKRSDILADLMAGKTVVAVAGAHGKTTTTAMITHILLEAEREPSYIIGGTLKSSGQNAAVGAGDTFVIEADEYDHMFLGLRPNLTVITNIDWDHPDFFPSYRDMFDAFERFAGLLPDDGLLIACADSPGARTLAEARRARGLEAVTYGTQGKPDWALYHGTAIFNQQAVMERQRFRVFRWPGGSIINVELMLPGAHNTLNATAALIAVERLGVPLVVATRALETFQGTGRRFEIRSDADGVIVIDDYAHHPTAIYATIRAARARYPDYALWVVWQPHTYSRTQALFNDYLTAFEHADHVLITDIYAAREQPVSGVSSPLLVGMMSHRDVRHTPTLADAAALLDREVQAPAVILILSAGDAPQIGQEFLRRRGKL